MKLTEEITSHNPRFLYKLDDPQSVTAFADTTGTYPPAQVGVSKAGAGSLTSGNQITVASNTGSSGTVVTVSNPNPGTNLVSAASFISLTSAGIKGPAAPGGSWTRMFAFRYTGPTPSGTAMSVLWSCFDLHAGGGSTLYWKIDTSGLLQMVMGGPTNNTSAYQPSTTSVTDSNWHLAIASYSHAAAQLLISLDGATAYWTGIDPTSEPAGLVSDSVGGWIGSATGNGSAWQYKGDLSFVAEFPTALTGTDCINCTRPGDRRVRENPRTPATRESCATPDTPAPRLLPSRQRRRTPRLGALLPACPTLPGGRHGPMAQRPGHTR
ncbi:hypothetical protein [Streptomyces blastmyceticus]|uniref:hypothetical protein n=1 Tax=Streptomyces blastmyceticus TaxID=68180 RepID=UPI0031CDD8B0